MELEIKRFMILVFPYVLCTTLSSLIIWGENLKKHLPRLLVFTLVSSITQTATYQLQNEALRFPLEVVSGFLVAIIIFRQPLRWVFKIYMTSYILGIISTLPVVLLYPLIFGLPPIELINNSTAWLVIPLPLDLLLVLICFFIRKSRLPVLGFINKLKHKLSANWPILVAIMIQIILFAGLDQEVFNLNSGNSNFVENAVIQSITFILFGLSIFIFLRFLKTTKKGTVISTQNAISENIKEMINVIRGQRHDFLNQLQVIGALSQQGNLPTLQEYVNKLLNEVAYYNEILKLDNPILSALINVKITQANARGIKIKADISSAFSGLEQYSIEIARILGNLIDNAMEAVERTDVEKLIKLEIYEKGPLIIMEVKNQVTEEILNTEEIYLPGYTTKGDSHSGMGLFNCRQIAKKIHADVVCLKGPQNEIRFSLVMPKIKAKVEVNL